MTALDDALLAAHADHDRNALVDLYILAADQADTIDASCFYLTHAYIFGLETDHPKVPTLHNRLKAHGRV